MGPSKEPSTPAENQAPRSARGGGERGASSPPAQASLFAEGMRAAIPTGASADPLLQPGVSRRRPEMAGVEGATALSPIGSGQAEAAGAKPALPQASPAARRSQVKVGSAARGSSQENLFGSACDRPGC